MGLEDPIETVLGLGAVIALVAANAVFVAGEFALVTVERASVQAAAEAGDRRARLVQSLLRRLTFHLSGAQLGVTFASLLLGFAAVPVIGRVLRAPFEHLLGSSGRPTAAVVGFVVATVGQLVLAELIPKNLAVVRARSVAYFVAPILRVYGIVFKPLIAGLDRSARYTVRLLGVEPRSEVARALSPYELERLVAASGRQGTLDPEAARLLTRSIRFAGKTASDALVPRVSVVSVERSATAFEVAQLAVASGYSRFPVVEPGSTIVVGVVLAKDVLRLPREQRANVTAGELMTGVLEVPESRDLESLLAEMRGHRFHLAVVLDEFGDLAGIVTIEDLVEEIVGDIEDEYDNPVSLTRGFDGTVVLEGTAHLDEVEEASGLRLPESGDFETIAGFVLARLDRIPVAGDVVDVDGWKITVTEMDRLRIARVALTPPAVPAGEGLS